MSTVPSSLGRGATGTVQAAPQEVTHLISRVFDSGSRRYGCEMQEAELTALEHDTQIGRCQTQRAPVSQRMWPLD
jgi:hypothetical protein